MAILAALVLLAVAWPVQAAIELRAFTVFVTPNNLVLQWETLAEYNIDGFEVLCKEEAEPASAYHPIGSVVAEGSPVQGATYTFDVTSLEQGVSYCFRITELTNDGTPGESFDRCGFGLGITPTPVPATLQPSGVIQVSPLQTPGADENPIPAGAVPQATATQFPPAAGATATPTFTPVALTTPTFTFTPAAVSPLATPTPTQVGESPVDAASVQATADAAATIAVSATIAAQATLSADPAALTLTPTTTPMEETGLGDGNAGESLTDLSTETGSGFDPEEANSLSQRDANSDVNAAAQALPTPLYVVVTVTPTPETNPALAAAPPTFTPLPTVTPATDTGLFALTELTTENLLLATLCLVFFGASGIGVLGITSLGLYFRSRPDRRR